MEHVLKDNHLTIFLGERLDTNNAEETEREINEIFGKTPTADLELDLKNTEYVSSAGLRIILKLGKLTQTLKITNVREEVYEVFEMTGFTEMLKIEKA